MQNINIKGLGVALVTPFKENLSVDFNALEKLLDHVIDGGVDYIVALGTTAETPTLTAEEKILIRDFIKEKNEGRVPLVVGIGGNNTRAVTEELKSANLDGYTAVLSVTPYYNKPTQEGLFQHYKTISEASSIPVILYNVPGRTGVNLTADTTIRLKENIKNIIGIKEASGNFEQSKKIIDHLSEFLVISGDDSSTYDLMKMGACGVISVLANALPKEVKRLVEYCENKEFVKAERLQTELKPLTANLFREGNPSGVKALLNRMGLIENITRLPIVPVSKNLENTIFEEASGFLLND